MSTYWFCNWDIYGTSLCITESVVFLSVVCVLMHAGIVVRVAYHCHWQLFLGKIFSYVLHSDMYDTNMQFILAPIASYCYLYTVCLHTSHNRYVHTYGLNM